MCSKSYAGYAHGERKGEGVGARLSGSSGDAGVWCCANTTDVPMVGKMPSIQPGDR